MSNINIADYLSLGKYFFYILAVCCTAIICFVYYAIFVYRGNNADSVIKKSDLDSALDFARSMAKRLDEHRETVEAIEEKTNLFDEEWHIWHLATQDDYLMRIFYLRYGVWPKEGVIPGIGYVRKRPEILGKCRLPEYN